MFEVTFVALGAVAVVATIMATRGRMDDLSQFIWSVLGAVLWAVWAVQATGVETVSSGVVIESSYTSLVLVGGVFAAVMVLSAILRFGDLYNA